MMAYPTKIEPTILKVMIAATAPRWLYSLISALIVLVAVDVELVFEAVDVLFVEVVDALVVDCEVEEVVEVAELVVLVELVVLEVDVVEDPVEVVEASVVVDAEVVSAAVVVASCEVASVALAVASSVALEVSSAVVAASSSVVEARFWRIQLRS